jgi:hypothetical protein
VIVYICKMYHSSYQGPSISVPATAARN